MAKIFILTAVCICVTQVVLAEDYIEWGYSGISGPEHWGELTDEFELCASGKNQSPINLSGFTEADLEPLHLNYSTFAKNIVNNGHTIQVNYAPGSTLSIDETKFELKQFHFHSPSENQINGEPFPLEAHFVHVDEKENLAVIAILFSAGTEENPIVEKLWSALPEKEGETREISFDFNGSDLLPPDRSYYRYNGSLTTPPCTEGVRWLVLKTPVTIAKEQVKAISKVMHHSNNRPVQPINARVILK